MVKDLLVAERYARALFELAKTLHCDEKIEVELDNLSRALKAEPELEKFFDNPYLKTADKRKFLQKLYQERQQNFYETLLDFYTVLFEKNRFGLIHEIRLSFKRIADEAKGQGVAEIRSAVALDAKHESQIVQRLEEIAGYKILVQKTVDASLIGGVVVKIKNKIIDGSVKFQMDLLKKELTAIRGI